MQVAIRTSMMMLAVTGALTSTSERVDGQTATPAFAQHAPTVSAPTLQDPGSRSGFSAFAVEALGATAGSALGFGAIYLSRRDECEVEDLSCNLENAAAGVAVGTIGSAVGAYVSGRVFDTQPSGVGAALGAVAGAAAGLGMWHLFTEELNLVNKSGAATATYVVTQGIVTALGSRLVRALK